MMFGSKTLLSAAQHPGEHIADRHGSSFQVRAYFTERDRWFRESVTDAVRLHS